MPAGVNDVSDVATSRRKDAHLDLCATGDVVPAGNATLFDDVHLVHCALPELSLEELSLRASLFGKQLQAPVLITGMTGGSQRAGEVNRQLAEVAERFGVAFGVGSQRAMAERPELTSTFAVRDVAPTTVLIGNVGIVQARQLGADGVRRLMDAIGADAIAVHLNPGQELTQPEGDRDFRQGYATLSTLAKHLGDRLLVKETGCGISPAVARRLVEIGVRTVDVSGSGGTSWVRVEQLRATGVAQEVGAQFSGWGIPTAAAVASVRRVVGSKATVIASGGIRHGLDVAKALALGADVAGLALPLFRAQQQGGVAGAAQAMEVILAGLKQALLLCGARDVPTLRSQPRVLTGTLKDWLTALPPDEPANGWR